MGASLLDVRCWMLDVRRLSAHPMKLELSLRERTIGIALSAMLLILVFVVCICLFQSHRTLILQADILRSDLSAVTNDRDAKANELAPFESLAGQQFPSEPPENRLPLLLRRIKAITSAGARLQGRRHLDSVAIPRIRARLDSAPILDIEVGCVWQDAEALALAEELKTVFESAGFKTQKLAQYVSSPHIPVGLAVYSKHELDHVLSEAIAQIFAELEQEPIQWLEDDEVSAAKPSEPQPDLKIIVGHR